MMPGSMHPALSASVRQLAAADFSSLAAAFSAAGFSVRLPATGMIQIGSSLPPASQVSLLLSVGIHGDETGPIEMLAQLLDDLAAAPQTLGVNLMVAVGNLAAIGQGKRFVEADLNRLFRTERGELATVAEAPRADALMRATAAFFAQPAAARWHLDLHTAIRRSHYPTFAIVPDVITASGKQALNAWLGEAGIGAVILNPTTAGTYSAWTASQFGAFSSTVELGQVGVLGQNDLSLLARPQAALGQLLHCGQPPAPVDLPRSFRVAQEIIKLSQGFEMVFDRTTQNFTALPAGAVIARDGATVYTVKHAQEWVVFPNPEVRVGQRAGLMVVPQE
jgi:succinylglutamate desuccinylase